VWDRQHCQRAQQRKNRHQHENGPLREEVPDGTRRNRDGDVARMIECRVAPHAACQLSTRVEPQGERRDGRAEHVADDRDQAIGCAEERTRDLAHAGRVESSKPGDQHDTSDQQRDTECPQRADRVHGHVDEPKLIDDDRHDEIGADGYCRERASADPIDEQ
jgi:hypothetical protein